MNALSPEPKQSRPTPVLVTRRRAARQRSPGQSPEIDLPVLMRLPDVRNLAVPWAAPTPAVIANSLPATVADVKSESPTATATAAATVVDAPIHRESIPAATPANWNSPPKVATPPAEPPAEPPVEPPAEASAEPDRPVSQPMSRFEGGSAQPRNDFHRSTSHVQRAISTIPSAQAATEPASVGRERRRRREDEVPTDSQSMTKQWATVLVLVTVISTSFYLMNRPRSQQDTTSGTRNEGTVADELARKNRDRRPTESKTKANEQLESLDESESMAEPEVPATRTDASGSSLEASDTADLHDEVNLIPTRRYPSTDPQRYEFRPLEIRNAERGSPTSSR